MGVKTRGVLGEYQLGKVMKQLNTTSGSLDKLWNTRTNQIERRLRSVGSLDGVEVGRILELPSDEDEDEDEPKVN